MKTPKLPLTIDNLLGMIDFLPSGTEKPEYCVYNIIEKGKVVYTGSETNYLSARSLIDRAEEGKEIRKKAISEIENIYRYITIGTYNADSLKEKSELLRKLIRLTIIAY